MALDLSAIGKKIGPISHTYDWKDVVLYALGVGAGADELAYVYENQLQVIPSFAVISIYNFLTEFVTRSGVNLAGILHGEHELILHHPIPAEGGALISEAQINAIYDKGAAKGALVIGQIDTYHEQGHKLFTNIATLFSRLDGGFGGEPGPKETFAFPEREPDFEELAQPSVDQPLIYRLSGDTFALHVDPDFARMSGFERPIMHGLCTHGYACRAVIKHLFPGEAGRLTRFRNRFSGVLYPGVPIKTQIWQVGEGEALFRTINAETGEVVLDRGVVEWMGREEAARRAQVTGIRFDGQVAIVTGAGVRPGAGQARRQGGGERPGRGARRHRRFHTRRRRGGAGDRGGRGGGAGQL